MATIPVEDTSTVGGRILAAWANSDIRDAVNFFLNPPRVLAYEDVNLQNMSDVTYTSIALGKETAGTGFDSDGMHSTVTNISRLTCVTPGTFLLNGGVAFASNSTGYRRVRWALNGASLAPIAQTPAVSGTVTVCSAPSLMIVLAAGDYVEIQGYHNSGGTLATSISTPAYPWASALWVAA